MIKRILDGLKGLTKNVCLGLPTCPLLSRYKHTTTHGSRGPQVTVDGVELEIAVAGPGEEPGAIE